MAKIHTKVIGCILSERTDNPSSLFVKLLRFGEKRGDARGAFGEKLKLMKGGGILSRLY